MNVALPPEARRALAALRPVGRPRAGVIEPDGLPPRRIVTLPVAGRLAIRDSGGTGPAVVLLHGWGITGDVNFRQLMPRLARDHRVICLDHRGHGARPGPFDFAACAVDLRELLDVLEVERAVLCGYSLGGSVALEFGRRHPGRTAGIALQATALAYDRGSDRLLELGLRCVRPFARLGLGRTVPLRYFAAARASDPQVRALWPWLRRELTQAHPAELVRAGIADLRYDFRPHTEQVRGLPIAVLVTTRDREVPPADQRAMAAALDAAVTELAADHDVFLSEPERYVSAAVSQIGALADRLASAD